MAGAQNKKSTISSDLIAGMTASIPSIPDAMASGVLAGVSPIYGLYGLMIGTPVAAVFTGSAFMSVVTTSAMAITIGTTLVNYQGEEQLAAVVLLRLRDRDEIGSTFIRVITRYASSLESNQGKLVLAGVSEHIYHQLQKTDLLDQLGQENIYQATSIMGDSSITAYQDTQQWLVDRMDDVSPANDGG